MLRAIYIVLLRLHPRFFRQEFADEMLWIFDQSSSTARVCALLGDALRSLATQWMFRSDLDDEASLAGVGGSPSDRVPVFYSFGSDSPPPGALLNGLIGSIAVFAAACFAMAHSGASGRIFTYYGDDFHSGPPVFGEVPARQPAGEISPGTWERIKSLFHKSKPQPPQTAGEFAANAGSVTPPPGSAGTVATSGLPSTGDAGAGVQGGERPPPPPGGPMPPRSAYFRLVPILAALDTDHDGVISAAEIASAPDVLAALDKNHDGKLEPEECGYQNGGGKLQRSELSPSLQGEQPAKRLSSQDARRQRVNFMLLEPVLAALDSNHDGVISLSEIRSAKASLKTLDRNHDGRLTFDEVLRDPVAAEAAAIFQLDTNFDGRISRIERRNEFGEYSGTLLDAADGNGDGYVTWEELTAEIRRRADLNHDGRVTSDEMSQVRKSGALYGRPLAPKASHNP